MLKLFTKNDIQEMIDKGMTLEQIQDEIGFTNIGQGYGYKSEEAFILSSSFGYEDTYICYIPEGCYKELSDGTKQIDVDSCYSRKDFNDLTQDKTKTEVLFESVDWQHPSSLWDEWGNDFELGEVAEFKENVDHLMAFIEQEVPYRLKNYLDYAVSNDIVATLVAKVQENTDVMFDYDKFDDFLRNQCEHLMELNSNKINSIRSELCNLRHELDGAAEFDPDMVPKIERRMRDLEIELNKVLKKDFKNNNFIDDAEKMKDFNVLSKEEFLQSYSYLTEEEYENTKLLVTKDMFVFDEDVLVNDDNESLNGYLWAVDALVNRLSAEENKENINFYADYNLKTGEIKLTSTYDILTDDCELNKVADISLSAEEKQKLIYAFEKYCRKDYGKSCLDLLNAVRIEEGLKPLVFLKGKFRILSEDGKEFVLKAVEFPGHNIKELEKEANKGSVDIPCRIYLEKPPCKEYEDVAKKAAGEKYNPSRFFIEATAGRDEANEPWQTSNWFVFYANNNVDSLFIDDSVELLEAWDYVKERYAMSVKKDWSLDSKINAAATRVAEKPMSITKLKEPEHKR